VKERTHANQLHFNGVTQKCRTFSINLIQICHVERLHFYTHTHMRRAVVGLLAATEAFRSSQGPCIAQAVSRRLPTAVSRVGARVRSCGICGGHRGSMFSPSTSVSSANSHSTVCSTIITIYHLALVQEAKQWSLYG
jgi:hypothetical protein